MPAVRRFRTPCALAPRRGPAGLTPVALMALGGCASHPAPLTRHGDDSTVYATGVKVAPGAPLYFSAGMVPGANAGPTMKAQALDTLRRLGENLATAGLKPSDVLFVRAYLAPGPDGKVDYAGWDQAWFETFGTASKPVRPALTTVAVPLLGNASTLIEVEYVCATAPAADLFASSDRFGLPVANPMLKPYGTKEACF